jgi:hypothetical protein
MKAVNQDKPLSIAANKNWRLLPNLQNALCDFSDEVRVKGAPFLDRDVDAGNRKPFALIHSPPTPS